MTWTYSQSTGQMTDPNGNVVAIGYSGHGEGVNNPALQFVPNVGPLPQGTYTIGPPHDPIDILGPVALWLYPDPNNDMQGRNSFFIHGDNSDMNQTASDGCIIMPRDIREAINTSSDKTLVVVA